MYIHSIYKPRHFDICCLLFPINFITDPARCQYVMTLFVVDVVMMKTMTIITMITMKTIMTMVEMFMVSILTTMMLNTTMVIMTTMIILFRSEVCSFAESLSFRYFAKTTKCTSRSDRK